MSTSPEAVTVVIPNWNGRAWLGSCLKSLSAQEVPPHGIIVVDNGSGDGSVDYLEAEHPEVIVLRLDRNTGFAYAANRGLEAAQSEFVAMINTDVLLAPDWIKRMAKALSRRPDAAAVACKMVDLNEPARIYDAGDVLRRDGACEQRGRFARDDGRWDAPSEVFGACAGAALYRRTAVASVCGFDERYFAYLEDVDLALRLRLAGWTCVYEPATAFHAAETSSERLPGGHLYLVERNTLMLVVKAFPPRWLPLVAYRQTAWAYHAFRERRLGWHLRGAAAAVRLLPGALRERRRLREAARVPVEVVVPARPIRGSRAGGHRSQIADAEEVRARDLARDVKLDSARMSGTRRLDLPRPPRELAARVFAVEGWSDPDLAYDELGAQTKDQLLRLLPDDWSFTGKRVLDFGSGAGRTLRHFAQEAETAEFWGSDIDEPSISWMQENLSPPFHAWQSTINPPLGLEHASFDLIYAISVFTHLTDNSAQWLLELHRLLKPGGLLIATYMGRWNSEWFAREPWVEDRVGMNVLYHSRDWDSGGPVVLMSEWWVREHWGRAFEIVHIAPQFHNFSWAVMRKRDVELTTEDIDRPADNPREYAALRHNVRQLQREVVDQAAFLHRYCEDVLREQANAYEARIREYEDSASWNVTRPLRRLGRTLHTNDRGRQT